MTTLEELFKTIKDMAEENSRLKAINGNYVAISQHLELIGEKLVDLRKELLFVASEIDPLKAHKPSKEMKPKKAIIADWYNKMTQGMTVTRKLLETTYPDFNNSDLMYVLSALGRMPNVKKRREGIIVTLYI